MNKRLLKIAEFIGKQKCMYDIGCDHAFLSIYAIKNHLVQQAINFDINLKPLTSGMKNVKKEGLEDKIKFVLNDGLKGYQPQVFPDVVCISGMGANLMIEIIENTPFTVKTWILQPNNNADKLRAYMNDNGYEIYKEAIIYEHNIYYDVMKFIKVEGPIKKYSEKECFFGPINLLKARQLLELRYLSDWKRYETYDFYKLNPSLQKRILLIKELLNK